MLAEETRPGVFLVGAIPSTHYPPNCYVHLDTVTIESGINDLYVMYLLRDDGLYEESTRWRRDSSYHWLL